MRKICSSRRISWIVSLSPTALVKSVPKGFSMITRERSTRPQKLSSSTTPAAAIGGTLR